jgi:hypothetical protein
MQKGTTMQETPFVREERVSQLHDRSETGRDAPVKAAGKEHQEFYQICSVSLSGIFHFLYRDKIQPRRRSLFFA